MYYYFLYIIILIILIETVGSCKSASFLQLREKNQTCQAEERRRCRREMYNLTLERCGELFNKVFQHAAVAVPEKEIVAEMAQMDKRNIAFWESPNSHGRRIKNSSNVEI